MNTSAVPEPPIPGLEVLTDSSSDLESGQRFRPADPREEGLAQRVPTGLQGSLGQDTEGVEAECPFRRVAADRPITAIDAGVVNLGHTPDGVVGAVRAAAITHRPDGTTLLRTYRPGLFSFNSRNRLHIFHAMGCVLGRPDFYVQLDSGGHPTQEKVDLAPHDHRLLDRARNYVERLVQRQLADELSDGILALDGALTLRTYDTPHTFLRQLHAISQTRNLTLIAISKHTGLTVRGVDIRLLLSTTHALPGRRKLTKAIGREQRRTHRVLGDIYIARFAPGGAVYRVDVDPEPGYLSSTAIDEFYASCLHRNGYPEPLIEAHAFSYMPPPLVAQLQAHAIVMYGLEVTPDVDLTPIFAPFGGRWK